MNNEIRVIFAGHSGLRKSNIAERLCTAINASYAHWHAAYFNCEDFQIDAFLDAPDETRLELWRRSASDAVNDANNSPASIKILNMHLTYQRYGSVFTPYSWHEWKATGNNFRSSNIVDEIIGNKFKPDFIFTLINNVFDVKANLQAANYQFSLRDLFNWRNIELMMADCLANRIIPRKSREKDRRSHRKYGRSILFSVNQPLTSIINFLITTNMPRLYLSYPIRAPRRNVESVDEINRFRQSMADAFPVFDPVTIDELPLKGALEALPLIEENDKINLTKKQRWNLDYTSTLSGIEGGDIKNLARQEVEEVAKTLPGMTTSIIERQIEERDYRLIDQADCVVCYRPRYGGKGTKPEFSGGTSREWEYAALRGKTRVLINDPVDGELTEDVWRARATEAHILIENFANLANRETQYKALAEAIAKIKERFPGG